MVTQPVCTSYRRRRTKLHHTPHHTPSLFHGLLDGVRALSMETLSLSDTVAALSPGTILANSRRYLPCTRMGIPNRLPQATELPSKRAAPLVWGCAVVEAAEAAEAECAPEGPPSDFIIRRGAGSKFVPTVQFLAHRDDGAGANASTPPSIAVLHASQTYPCSGLAGVDQTHVAPGRGERLRLSQAVPFATTGRWCVCDSSTHRGCCAPEAARCVYWQQGSRC